MKRTKPPRYTSRGLDYLFQTCLFWIIVTALFIGIFGVPYLRIERSSYYGTYSNGIDSFNQKGDILPLIILVRPTKKYGAIYERIINPSNI